MMCSNGVTLIADRKVTTSDHRVDWADKLEQPIAELPIIWGASGYQALYDSYNRRATVNMELRKPKNWREVAIVLENTYEEMASIYGARLRNRGLSVLIGQRPYADGELWLIEEIGAPRRISDYCAIGSGAQYGEFFLKHSLPKSNERTMMQAAEIGYLIIKYIEDFQLDLSVGIRDPTNGRPDIWFIPHNSPNVRWDNTVRKADDREFSKLEPKVNRRMKRLANLI